MSCQPRWSHRKATLPLCYETARTQWLVMKAVHNNLLCTNLGFILPQQLIWEIPELCHPTGSEEQGAEKLIQHVLWWKT